MSLIYSFEDCDIKFHHTLDEKPDPENFSLHTHFELEVYYFIKGKGKYLVEGNIYELRPGTVLLMRSAEAHKIVIDPSEPYERIAIHFMPDLFKRLDREELLISPFLNRALGYENSYDPEEFAENIWKKYFSALEANAGSIPGEKIFVFSALLSLLTEICAIFKKRLEKRGGGADINKERGAKPIIDYINKNLFGELSLDILSGVFFLSRSQINRIFKKEAGTSVGEYIRIKRLMAARERIEYGEPAGEVCISCGFKDYSSFYRAYRDKFGYSPKMTEKKKDFVGC